MFSLTWTPGVTLDHLERHAIEQAFRFYQSNKTQTARALDISIRTLETKLEKYAIDDERAKESFDHARTQREELLRRQRGIHSEQSTLNTCNGIAESGGFTAPAPAAQADASRGRDSDSGVRVEPAAHVAPKQPVPVSERQEVQGMLPAKAAASGVRKAR